MRYSSAKPQKPTTLISEAEGNLAFVEAALEAAGAQAGPGSLLLVGGNDLKSLALRRAQAAIRFDRRPSQWSHAAIIVRWDRKNIGSSTGVEVAIDPADPASQVPERNGVTEFQLSRYLDESAYPNVSLSFVKFDPRLAKDRTQRLLEALANPNLDRLRYPFWDLLGRWAQFVFEPIGESNPLLDNTPLPAAAFCEYVYDAAGVDLTPGATGNYSSPEVLYATMKHWRDSVEATEGAAFQSFAVVRDADGHARAKLPGDFQALVSAAARGTRAEARGKTGKKQVAKKTAAKKVSAKKATKKSARKKKP